MILVDAGPLVALVDADDQYHKQCVSALKSLQEPLATVWPPLTEAMYPLNIWARRASARDPSALFHLQRSA